MMCNRVTLAALALWVAGCPTAGLHQEASPTLTAADLNLLTGPAWVGTLTYLDYTSKEQTTIDSSLIVRQLSENSWEFGVGYSREPHADAKEVVVLASDGRQFGAERVVAVRRSGPGSTGASGSMGSTGELFFVTEGRGPDDNRPATFRFEHRITATEYTRRKLVRFDGTSDYFQRHVYQWKR